MIFRVFPVRWSPSSGSRMRTEEEEEEEEEEEKEERDETLLRPPRCDGLAALRAS